MVLESTLARIGDVSATLAGGTAVGGQQAAANWAHQQAVFFIRNRMDFKLPELDLVAVILTVLFDYVYYTVYIQLFMSKKLLPCRKT